MTHAQLRLTILQQPTLSWAHARTPISLHLEPLMAQRLSPHAWTVERLWDLPDDGNRYELIDGDLLVTPAPTARHQWAVAELFAQITAYCRQIGVYAAIAPATLIESANTAVQPDLLVIPPTATGARPMTYEDFGTPLLVIEVLSPSSARVDRERKLHLYQRMQIPEYWIVDAETRIIERWRPLSVEPEHLDAMLEWQPTPTFEPLRIDLVQLFRDVNGELTR
jgi:Uma2 family endonuclease